MTLPLTPHMLAGCYEFLRTTPPFRGWHLPHAEQVEFAVTRHKMHMGAHVHKPPHLIDVSAQLVGHTSTLIWIIGHEMIHVHQAAAGLETPKASHNADFRRKATIACRYHGWDPRIFI